MRQQKISLIVAWASDGAIGYNGKLPWPHHSEDMKRFREATLGKAVIMGRTTWESLKAPLEFRHNIVLTSKPDQVDPTKADCAKNIPDALKIAGNNDVLFIGGRTVYSQCMVFVNHYILTEIHGKWPGDTYFRVPFLDSKILIKKETWEHPSNPSLNCTFKEYINRD